MKTQTRYFVPKRGKFKGCMVQAVSIEVPINLKPKAACIRAKRHKKK